MKATPPKMKRLVAPHPLMSWSDSDSGLTAAGIRVTELEPREPTRVNVVDVGEADMSVAT